MSMFLDQVTVNVKAGNGGDGMVAFRREKYVPDGGPAGGDGGTGGNIIFVVDEGLRTLMDFRYNRHFKAKNGENGMSKGMHGRGAKDLFVKVPPGTIVKNAETGQLYADLVSHGQEAVIAKGGRGGRGNIRFATPRNPAPEIAENGEPGEEKEIELELKVLADVGLIGFPSVGKSTLLSVVSAARPKIGAYHFTTIVPNLGMVETEDGRSFVLADMPGLIEGASQGVGLGIEFLRHIERTRVLLHVIDMSGIEGRVPIDDYDTINNELREYDLKLRERPQLVIANKMDMPDSQKNLAEFKEKIEESGEKIEIFEVSAISQKGLTAVLTRTADLLESTPEFPLYDEETNEEERVLYKHTPSTDHFNILREPDGTWVLTGQKLEKLYKMTNFAHDESVMRFARQIRGMGIDEALRKKGAKNGDIVRIDSFEFEFVE
ncbi:GTPase ObgE [Marinilactibacillus psychrotolerans]|uniref:GTPase Obg n=1 Tax=Marinilactibacillus psychrotolerans TaxID=191770 RepID=A0AAV3WRQ2_9LACT|nr:GTPase ObgE [Marinilactibacillus psychrotolerans]GEL67293.1 GTPase Obg [Marinilactibacillus psychrotolerans]GEQ36097.1 GTPase Obg [Marinilactibacillus psychrotolerans]SDC63455.1 GTP-binding protein [Marinilactibacillus psychrotolerans]